MDQAENIIQQLCLVEDREAEEYWALVPAEFSFHHTGQRIQTTKFRVRENWSAGLKSDPFIFYKMAETWMLLATAAASLGLLVTGFVLHMVGLATSSWITQEYMSLEIQYGLWVWCDVNSECYPYIEKSSRLNASGSFAIIGMLGGFAAIVLAFVHFAKAVTGRPHNARFPTFSAVAGFVTLGAIIVCVAIYASMYADLPVASGIEKALGYSFILSIVGGILTAAGESSFTAMIANDISIIIMTVGLLVQTGGLILHIVGLATPAWSGLIYGNLRMSYGLWQACTETLILEMVCNDYVDKQDKLKVCEAFAIIGVVLGLGAVVPVYLQCVRVIKKRPKITLVPLIGFAASCASLAAIVVCVAIWGTSYEDFPPIQFPGLELAYSFYLSTIGGILIVVGSSLVFVASRISE